MRWDDRACGTYAAAMESPRSWFRSGHLVDRRSRSARMAGNMAARPAPLRYLVTRSTTFSTTTSSRFAVLGRKPLLALLLLLSMFTACDSGRPENELHISVSASLEPIFEEIGTTYEQQHPNVQVILDSGSATDLITRANTGAPVDLLVLADIDAFSQLTKQSSTPPTPIAKNEMVIAVRRGQRDSPMSLEEVQNTSIVAMCVETAPCGIAGSRLLEAANLTFEEDQIARGANAQQALGLILHGDARAAVIYRSDLSQHRDDLRAISTPGIHIPTTAAVAIHTKEGKESRRAASDFVALLTGEIGTRAFVQFGFQPLNEEEGEPS